MIMQVTRGVEGGRVVEAFLISMNSPYPMLTTCALGTGSLLTRHST